MNKTEMKCCKVCNQLLPLDNFAINRKNEDGTVRLRRTICKNCYNKMIKTKKNHSVIQSELFEETEPKTSAFSFEKLLSCKDITKPTNTVSMSVTNKEWIQINLAAQAESLTVTDWIRKYLYLGYSKNKGNK